MISINLQKAFDTINHDILLRNLSIIRFSDDTVKWFQSSLPNRKLCGDITQGSIFGPLLFLIYVNDMPMAVKCNLFLYPDDACLVFQSDDAKDIEKQLNQDFANI